MKKTFNARLTVSLTLDYHQIIINVHRLDISRPLLEGERLLEPHRIAVPAGGVDTYGL
jgi:hypothetical protein